MEPGYPVAPPKPRKRRRGIFIAASTVAILLIGVGAYAGVRAWTGAGIIEPESVAPATAAAFVRIDLNPGVRDKLAFDGLLKKFPNAKSSTDLVTQFETSAAHASGLDYNTDIKPWFDGRIGFAMWTDATGRPVQILSLASKDDVKAKTALTKVQTANGGSGRFGFVVRGGYAQLVLADSDAQADATAAANEAAVRSLADDRGFKDATSKIGDANLVVAYIDLHRLGALMVKGMTGALSTIDPRLGPAQGLLGGATDQLDKLTGTYAIGAHITDDGVEIQVHGQGLDPKTMNTGSANVRPALDNMPAGSLVAVSTVGIDPASPTAKQLGTLVDSLLGGGSRNSGRLDPKTADMLTQLAPVLRKVLVAKVISFALTGITDKPTTTFRMQAKVQAQSAKDAAAIFGPLYQGLGGAPPDVFSIKRDGDTVQAAFGPVATGQLSTSPLYRKAMAGMDNEQFAAYIDIQAILDATHATTPANGADLAPLKAIGIFAHTGGTTIDVMARVIISA